MKYSVDKTRVHLNLAATENLRGSDNSVQRL